MSQTSVEATSNKYQLIFNSALESYQRKTGKDLTKDPLFHTLESCDSPVAVLTILRAQIYGPGQSHSSNDKLTEWLIPTVNVINVFSATIGGAVGQVSQPAGAIFTGIGIFLTAVRSVSDSQDVLLDLFTRIENIFRRLETYIEVPPTRGMTGAIVAVMVEVLSVLSIMTKEIKQNRTKIFLKKLAGNRDIEDALKRLENVTMEESRMTGAETLKAIDGVKVMIQGLTDMLQQGVNIRVNDTGDNIINSVEMTGQQSENRIDTVTAEGLEEICGRIIDVNEVRAVKDFVSTAIASDDLEKMTPPTASDFGGLSRDQLRQKFAEWLSPSDPSENYDTARRTQHRGTAGWFIESSAFREWRNTGCLLWIQGNPGSGKSVLTSAIIQDIEPSCNRGSAHLAYFFFDFKDARKQDARAFLSSVLIQLSSQSTSFFDVLLELYSTHHRGSKQPSDSALTQCLEKMLEIPSKFLIYIVVDALNECPDTSGVQSPREKVLALVEELVGFRFQVPNLRLCITSRPDVDIRNILEPLTSISNRISLHDEDGQKKDIADYISSVVYSDKKFMRWREKDKELVVKTLSKRAGGEFRWVSCQFDTLRGCLAPSVSRVLAELPETLDKTYERILKDIPKANRVHAHRLLQCLSVSTRPLRVQELAEVLAIDFNTAGGIPRLNEDWRWEDQERAVLTACSSLITIVDSQNSRMVQFSHSTVKEFLASDRLAAVDVDILLYHHILLKPAHTIMTQACVGVLLCLDQPINNETTKRFPLTDYAAKHFADHAEFGNVASQITNAIDELLNENKPHFSAWMSHISSSWWAEKYSGTFKASPLYYVADLGFRCLVQHLVLKRPQDVITRGGIYGTPMHAALRRRHLQVCELLLPHCIDLGIRDSNGQTLLHVAVGNGLVDVVQLIIGQGADINAQDSSGWTPLHQIINTYPQFDDSNLEIMRLLLDRGADIEAQDNDHVTPLCQAARNGQLAAAQLLVEHGAVIGKRDKLGRTPLHDASSSGYPDVIQLLLEHDADIQATDDEHNTPLHLAAGEGRLAAAQLLVERGANVHAQGNIGETPLHQASQKGSLDIIRLLHEHGADIQAQNKEQNAALHLAIIHEHFVAAQLLVVLGAYIHVRGNLGRTPLQFASYAGSHQIIRLLLEHRADIRATDDKKDTPLHLAVGQGKFSAAQLLITRGAIVNAHNNVLETPLHQASRNGPSEIIRLLLDHGADIEAKNSERDTSLHLAVVCGHSAAAQLLVVRGAHIHVRGKSGRTPLQSASYAGSPDNIRLLLGHGADIRATDHKHNTPLHLSVGQGKLAAAELLIERGADIHAQGNIGETPLHQASRNGSSDVIRLLLEHGADIEAKNNERNTPLHIAVVRGNSEAARLLIERGAIVHLPGNLGRLPLLSASYIGSLDIMRLLLEHDADIQATDDEHNTPLHLAASQGKLDAAQLLVERGAIVHTQDYKLHTPLHRASRNGSSEIIHLLLEHGADIRVQNNERNTPLHLAAIYGKFAAVQLLVGSGAIIHVRGNSGRTPLHFASYSGSLDIVRLLLERRADIEATDDSHNTPLHIAVAEQRLGAVRLLLEHGANALAQNKARQTPIQIATSKGNQDIFDLLSTYVRSGRKM